MKDYLLTVCVIGKDEGKNLPRLIDSLTCLSELGYAVESIYVDSASTDDSIDIALQYFDRVYSLNNDEKLCASAGRYWGTLHSHGKWILYLDGDMELRHEFVPVLKEINYTQNNYAGYVGQYTEIYPDDEIREGILGSWLKEGITTHFGGAVLLNRYAILTSGNWNPHIYSNEEIELYIRMRTIGYSVCFKDMPMVNHYNVKKSRGRKLIENFYPLDSGLGKKFYGFGQVLAASYKNNKLPGLIRYFPYPFVYWFFVLSAILALGFGYKFTALVLLITGISYVSLEKNFLYVALYTAFLIQGLSGWFFYDEAYIPEIVEKWPKTIQK